jgi:hypothetical protein
MNISAVDQSFLCGCGTKGNKTHVQISQKVEGGNVDRLRLFECVIFVLMRGTGIANCTTIITDHSSSPTAFSFF